MSGFVPALGWTLLHFLWQGLLIGCATALAWAALRNARPEARYAVGCGALLACLCWPAAGLYLRPAARGKRRLFSNPAAGRPAGARQLARPGPAAARIVGVWALCAAVLAARMALGMLWIAAQRQQDGGHACLGRRACPAWRTMRA
jgi:D-alanyl-D-alanine endopeptidase (penicillin-binding protein 7)